MSRKVKDLMVKEYTQRFSEMNQRGCVVFGYQGLDANSTNEVRKIIDRHDSEMFVIRNRLMALSLEEMGMSALKGCFQGPAALVMGSDPVQAARAVSSAKEEFAIITVLGGYAEGNVLAEPDVKKLSDIPDRDILLGQTIGLISSPARRFLNALNSKITGFASVLNELKQKKKEESEES